MSVGARHGCRGTLGAIITFGTRHLRFGPVAEVTSKTNRGLCPSRRTKRAIGTFITPETAIGQRTVPSSGTQVAFRYVASSSAITECSIWTRYWVVCSIKAVLANWTWRGGVIREPCGEIHTGSTDSNPVVKVGQ